MGYIDPAVVAFYRSQNTHHAIICAAKQLAQAVLVRLIVLYTIPRDYSLENSILWGKISFPLQRFAEGATRRSPYQSFCNRHTASNERENHSKFRNGYEVRVFILSREKSTANLIIDSRIQKWRKSTLRSSEKMTKFESV